MSVVLSPGTFMLWLADDLIFLIIENDDLGREKCLRYDIDMNKIDIVMTTTAESVLKSHEYMIIIPIERKLREI